MIQLTKAAVQQAMLEAQGLLSPPASAATKGDILAVIRRMGYLQIDTIHVIQRTQYLVLWSRLGHYAQNWLDEIHADGHLFEYYAHALCYIPIEDYPIFRGRILYDDRVGNSGMQWTESHPDVIQLVRSVIKEKGPVCSADFDSNTISTGWGNAKPEKIALSCLFSSGELMVPYRKNFRRYYDFRERVLPEWDDALALDWPSARKALILKTIYALGVARVDWVPPYVQLLKTGLSDVLDELESEGWLKRVQVKGWDLPAYIHKDHIKMVESAARGELTPSVTTLLSPFDPLVSDRERALALFDFDYRMESYTPVKDRQYGYFCLPILHNGQIVGRLDPKAHRKEQRMEIKNIFLEPGVVVNDVLVSALKDTLGKFTSWHGLADYEITAAEPNRLRDALV